jgi:2-haloacid dehalogenase
MGLKSRPRALLFDVFGTCVDWRLTVTNGLYDAAQAKLTSASQLPSKIRIKVAGMTTDDWGIFAQEWRNTYKEFTRSRAQDASLPIKTVDEHHFDSLKELLTAWKLDGLWSLEEIQATSIIWHRLTPWADSESGLKALNSLFWTCTLSNGNLSLLQDLKVNSKLPFTHIFSAEEFGTFKPNKAVYLGAAEKLELTLVECAMVAAHLPDLKAAKACGYQTIYVERPQEEDWDNEKVECARSEGFVDMWINGHENGFLTVAERLGVEM